MPPDWAYINGRKTKAAAAAEGHNMWIFIVESRGKYKDFRWEVHLYSDGHRTGYVETKDIQYDLNAIRCHGKITYSAIHGEESTFLPEGSWIGFDCAHPNDAPDIRAAKKVFEEGTYYHREFKHTVLKDTPGQYSIKTLTFCKNECKSIIEQLLALRG